jgi:uncharacterized protein (TIGR02466 family)
MNQPHAAPIEIRSRNHWVTQIFTIANPDHAAIKQGLVDYCYELEKRGTEASTVAQAAKGNMFESKFNLLLHDQPQIRRLKDFCLTSVHQVAANQNADLWDPADRVQVGAVESWCHITRTGGYHDVHTHPMCSWCGIYYVDPGDSDVGDKNGVNRFYEPRINVNFYSDYATRYLLQEGSIDMPSTEGSLIVFPSYLRHSALPYTGKRDRIVVALNTRTQLAAPQGA